jgi:hypothetical protein
MTGQIETVGAHVRGRYGNLARITAVLEHSRCSPNHLTAPNDVVVTLEPVGPGFAHRSSWASDLTYAQPGDVGAHMDERNRYVPATWKVVA